MFNQNGRTTIERTIAERTLLEVDRTLCTFVHPTKANSRHLYFKSINALPEGMSDTEYDQAVEQIAEMLRL